MVLKKSPFPAGFLGVDLFYGGDWQPLGADLDQSGLSISHGVRSESGTADVSSLSFRLANPEGKYSPRNPNSPLDGLIGRNTPARARAGLGAPWLDLESPNARATTPSTAALSITGDIDIRWWGRRDSWTTAADLISKYSTTSDERSWIVRAEADGTLTLFWSEDGTATLLEARSGAPIPAWAGEIAIRIELDVDDDDGGHAVRFFYAADLVSAWVQLGEDVVGAGVTSLYASSAPLTLGKEPTSSAGSPPQRVYGWELLDAGVVVSSLDTSTRGLDETVFTDDQGGTWTAVDGSISNRHTLAVCEVAEWPMEWGTKGSESVMTAVEAAGVTRRLGQGEQPLDSAIYSTITGDPDQSAILGYWPMEDGTDATSFGPAIGQYSTTWGKTPALAAYAGFGGSKPIPELGESAIRFRVRRVQPLGVQVRHLIHLPPGGVGGPSGFRLLDVNFNGSGGADLGVAQVWVNEDGAILLRTYNSDGVEVGSPTWINFDANGKNLRLSLILLNNGSDVDYRVSTTDVAGAQLSFTGTVPNRNLDPVRDVLVNPRREDFGATALGHLTVENRATGLIHSVPPAVLAGYQDESAAARMTRLTAERDIPFLRRHDVHPSLMGPQAPVTFLDLMREAAAADEGILHDDPHDLGLRYRSLQSLGSQPPVIIPYQDNLVIPFRPSDDDALTRNRVTVSRPHGTRYTAELTEGPMSSARPQDGGVGLYDTALELNVSTDELVRRTADWRLHLGTWDEGRYPRIGVDLADPRLLADPLLVRSLLGLTPGARLVITDPPPWLPPRSVDVLVMGVQIAVTPLHLRLTWTCIPARPYRVAYWSAGHRWSAAGTQLAAAVSPSATVLPLTVPQNLTWTHADGDYDITVGGERMTVTDVSGTDMTVTRSVNGVVKAHLAGAAVGLAEPSFYAR